MQNYQDAVDEGGDAVYWTFRNDESNTCVDDVERVPMCELTSDFQAETTALIQNNNDIINFGRFLDGYEC